MQFIWISGSWKEVEASTIQKCFSKCGFSGNLSVCNHDKTVTSESENDNEDEVPLAVLRMSKELFSVNFQELIEIDRRAPVCVIYSACINWEDIVQGILSDLRANSDKEMDDDDGDDDKDDDVNDSDHCVSAHEAGNMIEKLNLFALRNGQDKILDNIMNLQERFVSSRWEVHSKQ